MKIRRPNCRYRPAIARLSMSCGLLLALAGWVAAEKLPIKTYTIADGLALDQVNAIRQDSRHLLWFATSDGVSWFDGYEFISYTTHDGLPHPQVNDILQTRAGDYWLATGDGLCRFVHEPRLEKKGLFEVFRPNAPGSRAISVDRIVEDVDGSIWCGTAKCLYHFARAGRVWAFEDTTRGELWGRNIHDLTLDRSGVLWIVSDEGVFCREPSGRVTCRWSQEGLSRSLRRSVAVDRDGILWVGTTQGLYSLPADIRSGPWPAPRRYTTADGLPYDVITKLLVTAGGRLWVGTGKGLAVRETGASGRSKTFRAYTLIHGLADRLIVSLGEDDDGNLWVGTEHGGVMKISRTGFCTFDEADGLAGTRVESVFTDRNGTIGFLIWPEPIAFTVTDGRRFTSVPLPGTEDFGWIGWQSVCQDHSGEWWLATGRHGLWRYHKSVSFTGLAGRKPDRVYTTRDGLPADNVFSVFEDSRGDIWLGIAAADQHLCRWDRNLNRFVNMGADDLPLFFAEDRSANIWIGFFGIGLWRLRQGRITAFTIADGLPAGSIPHIFQDRQGRLWISSGRGGAACVPDPAAEHPRFIPYTRQNGLSSDRVHFVLEDRWGRFYFGTVRGVDRLDPRSGAMEHFTAADGLAANYQNVAVLDRNGAVWFGTGHGISRLMPEAPQPRRPPSVWIRKLRCGGVPYPLDELGQYTVQDVQVPLERNRIEIDFTGRSFAAGDVLTYRYQLGGPEAQWRTLPQQRTLELVNVRPGTYRFAVEAINSEGLASPQPAVITFTVLAPLWQRWWFIGLALLAAGGTIFLIVRFRVQRRVALERMRTRIATDLHDDIGASLSQIAILSEVAVHGIPAEAAAARDTLAGIAATSRELVESMSDIVWAINPRRERLSDLVRRMRRFAIDLFAEGGITHTFQAPETGDDLQLNAELRRQVYLVFKECLHNVVRHSRATTAASELRLSGDSLELEVSDNGDGFDPADTTRHGHGLTSIRDRAKQLGGEAVIASRPGAGTRITFRAPLPGRFRFHRRRPS